jgi:hypothetical protein
MIGAAAEPYRVQMYAITVVDIFLGPSSDTV